MKKAFCFSLIAIIIALASAPALVKADDVTVITPYIDTPTLSNEQIYNLENASLLLEYLRKGGTIDVRNINNEYTADDLLSDFGSFVREVVGDFVDIVNPFQTEVEYHGLQPISPSKSAIIQFMGALPFYALNPTDDDSEPTPTPPNQYAQLIDIINGSGFYWRDWNVNYGNNVSPPVVTTDITSMSWVKSGNYGINIQSYPSPIITISIVGDDTNGYDILYSNYSNSSYTYVNDSYRIMYNTNADNNPNNYLKGQNVFSAYYGINYYGNNYFANNYGHANTLSIALTNISNFFRNVNIYVNGELWAYVNNNTNYKIEISTGTTVPIKDGTGKVEWLYDYEIYFDIDRIQDDLNSILWEIRNTPNTPTIIKFDDLQDVIVDVNGSPAIAVKVVNNELSLDDRYSEDFGPIIPLFVPMFTPVINDTDIVTVTDVSTSALPDELLEVCGYVFVGTLFACFIHRLLE